jgi:hypothetical protein
MECRLNKFGFVLSSPSGVIKIAMENELLTIKGDFGKELGETTSVCIRETLRKHCWHHHENVI